MKNKVKELFYPKNIFPNVQNPFKHFLDTLKPQIQVKFAVFVMA